MNIIEHLTQLEHSAADFGFKWETAEQIIHQIKSEIKEVNAHIIDGDRVKLKDEIGDLMHAVFSLCIFCQFQPEETLNDAVKKFSRRFFEVKRLAENNGLKHLNQHRFEELMRY